MSDATLDPNSIEQLRAVLTEMFESGFDDDELLANVTVLDSLMLAEVIAAADEILVPSGFSAVQLSDVDPHVLTFSRLVDLASGPLADASSVWRQMEDAIHLRPVSEADGAWLRELILNPSDAHRFIFRGRFSSPHSFLEDLTGSMAASFAVIETESGAPIGFVGLMGLNLQAGHAHVALAMAPAVRRTQYVAGAFLRVCRYGFRNFPLRKLYAQVPDFNLDYRPLRRGSLLVEEARLADHEYYDGRLWGVTYFSLTRDAFEGLKTVSSAERDRPTVAVGPDGWIIYAI